MNWNKATSIKNCFSLNEKSIRNMIEKYEESGVSLKNMIFIVRETKKTYNVLLVDLEQISAYYFLNSLKDTRKAFFGIKIYMEGEHNEKEV